MARAFTPSSFLSFRVPGPQNSDSLRSRRTAGETGRSVRVNEPTVAGMVAPTRRPAFGGSSLYMVLPIPETPEVRFAMTLGVNTFQLPEGLAS